MKEYAADLWGRAKEALRVAEYIMSISPDAAASRAYYAAFYAVSALLALEGKSYKKHSAVESAVHRDLVKTGRWPESLGSDYSVLFDLRDKGDYGGRDHVLPNEAAAALETARGVIATVQQACPELGELPPDEQGNQR